MVTDCPESTHLRKLMKELVHLQMWFSGIQLLHDHTFFVLIVIGLFC